MTDEEKAVWRYEEALRQLRQHPPLIWSRNNFFLLVQSGFLAVILKMDHSTETFTSWLLPVAGLFVAVIWFWVIYAGQILQRKWRGLVLRFEMELFGDDSGAFGQASAGIGEGSSRFISITTALLMLSGGFMAIWIALLVHVLLTGHTPS